MTIFFFCLPIACFFLGYSIARKRFRYVQTSPCGFLSELDKGERIRITSTNGFLIEAVVHVNPPDTERIVLEIPLEEEGNLYAIYDYDNSVFNDFEMLNVDSVERQIDGTDMQTV